MKVTIVILNYNGRKDTLECLKSLEKLEFKGEMKTVVVDNASTDGSVKVIKKKFPQVVVLENKKNLGYGLGNNVGIEYGLEKDSDYILLLNNDTLVDKGLLTHLVKMMGQDKAIGALSPKIYFASGYEFHKKRYKEKERGKVIWYAGGKIDWQNLLISHRGIDEVDKGKYEQTEKTDFATGCCVLIKKKVFEKIGLFDKKYFLYWEDVDLSQRIKKAGFKIVYTGKAFLWHKNASASGGAGKKTSVYYQTRNRLVFGFKYAGLRTRIALLKESINFLLKGTQWQKKAVKDFLLLKFGKIKL